MKTAPLESRIVFETLVSMSEALRAKNTNKWYRPYIRVAEVCTQLGETRARVKPALKELASQHLIRLSPRRVGEYQTIEVLSAKEATKQQDHAFRKEAVQHTEEMITKYVATQLGRDWQDESAMIAELRFVTDENDVVQPDKVRCELTFDVAEERLLDIIDAVASKLDLKPKERV